MIFYNPCNKCIIKACCTQLCDKAKEWDKLGRSFFFGWWFTLVTLKEEGSWVTIAFISLLSIITALMIFDILCLYKLLCKVIIGIELL
jgi:hypothetical protein